MSELDERYLKVFHLVERYGMAERDICFHETGLDADDCARDLLKYVKDLISSIDELEAKNNRLSQLLHDVTSQLEIATDLGNKRWIVLNQIYENGEKHNANWCKRKAQKGLGNNA